MYKGVHLVLNPLCFKYQNKSGKPLTPRWINLHLKELAAGYGINPEIVYPHSFRHRFAKNFLKL